MFLIVSVFLDLIFSRAMFSNNLSQYSGDGVTVTLQEFAHFLRKEQAQPNTLDNVASIMRDFLQVCPAGHYRIRTDLRVALWDGGSDSPRASQISTCSIHSRGLQRDAVYLG